VRFAYYPGCSLEGSAKEYDESLRAVMGLVGIELVEIKDWNCCGASAVHGVTPFLRVLLPARDLLEAESMGLDIIAPCAACFLRLKEAKRTLKERSSFKDKVEKVLDKAFRGEVEVYHPLEVLSRKEVRSRLEDKAIRPLEGVKAVCYYGCYLVRPKGLTGIDDLENPTVMETILEVVGVEVLDWSFKVDCCGGSHSLLRPELVRELSGKLGERARQAGADFLVTAFPLCQSNLEIYQGPKGVPVLYFTEILGVAMGAEGASKWLKRHLIKPPEGLWG